MNQLKHMPDGMEDLMATGESVWWYVKEGEKYGPFSAPELKQNAISGSLAPTDLIWKEGFPDWVPASSAKGLFPPPQNASPPPIPVTKKNTDPPAFTPPAPMLNKVVNDIPVESIEKSVESVKAPNAVWGRRFTAIKKLDTCELKDLTSEEKVLVLFNPWALFFGPFYYLAKGLWKKAIIFSLIFFTSYFILLIIADIVSDSITASARIGVLIFIANYLVVPIFYCLNANRDYYKKYVLKHKGWW